MMGRQLRTPSVALGLMLGFLSPVRAAEDEPLPVQEVRVEGLRRVDREAALAGIKTKVGEPLLPEVTTEDLHRVWDSGFFRDVRVEAEPVKDGWALIFVVAEKPSIREVRYVGRDDLSEDDVEGVVDVKPYTILNKDLLTKNVEKIKDLYVQKGFYLAEVSFRIEPVPGFADEVTVTFDIVENAKVLVRQITLIGNDHISDDTIKSILQTREGDKLSWITQMGTYKEEFFQTDLFRIQALYYDQGFVSVKVGEPTATISSDRRYIYLSVPIAEGQQYDVGALRFTGDVELKDADGLVLVDEELLDSKLDVQTGELFNRTKLFEDLQALTDVYRDHGYAYANVTPNSAINADKQVVDIDLEVERGELVRFDRVEIVGNTRTRDKVIRRELRVFEGDQFSSTLLNRSRERIFQLGYFETVNITTSRGSEPQLMNVRVEIKEKSTGTFQIGAGFSSVESFIATAQVSQNNFLGQGWLVSLSAQLSFGDFARQLATLQFFDPYFLDSMWSFGLDAYITQRYFREFQRNARGISPRLGYPITPDLRVSAGYTVEEIEIRTDLLGGGQSTGTALYNLNRQGISSAVNANVSYDTRDNRLFPSRGHYHVLSGEISPPLLGTDPALAFWRAQLFLRYYFPLPLSFVFKINASFGMVFGLGGESAPISERFFPGGIYSVRGFEPRGLGPTRSTLGAGDPLSGSQDFTIGGNKEAVFNLELEFPIIAAAGIKGVLFADAGNAFNDDENFFHYRIKNELKPKAFLMDSGEEIDLPLGLFYSFGFGFRWFSPIGPLRFEWGIPITKRDRDDENIIFEFTIGNFF